MAALSQAVHRLGEAKPAFAALALALYIFSLWVGAVRWQRLLLAMGCRVRVMRLLLVNLVGICANNVTLNSRVAGEGARLAALRVTDGVSADRLAISTLYERITDVVGGVLVVLMAIPAAWTIGASLRVTRSAIGIAAVVGVAVLLLLFARRRLMHLPIGDWWRAAVAKYVVSRSTLAFTTLCSVTISIQDPLRLMAGAAAFGVHLSLSQAAMVSAASMFASGIPTVGGLGAVEGGLIAALVALKVNVTTAVAITALERGISLVFSTSAGGLAGFWLGGGELWRRVRGRASETQPPSAPSSPRDPVGSGLPGGLGDLGGCVNRRIVLVVCGNGPDPITLRKIEALASSGLYDVHLAYWRDGGSLRTYPFSVALSPSSIHPVDLPDPNGPPLRGLGLLIRFHARVMSIAAAVQPDIVHAVNFDMLLGGWLLAVGRPHRTLVYDLLDTQESLRRWPVVMLQRAIMRRVDRIYATSPQFVSGFLRPLKLIRPDEHPVVIPNAPWTATFDGIARRRDGAFVVGYIGSFRSEPAITWLCESVADVRRAGMEVDVLFAGTGDARPLVEEMARRYPFVHHEGAYDYATQVRALYERVDLVFAVYDVSWDKRTHLACRLSDAIAAGRPIVAAAGTYMGELVDGHQLGYVVDFRDPPSLAAAIRDAVRRRADWSDPSRIPDALRREHTFERYVADLRSTYVVTGRQKSGRQEKRGAAATV
jgi:glycosyltransferase involved in cell wall biosynthesis